jgi:hypothetical protein
MSVIEDTLAYPFGQIVEVSTDDLGFRAPSLISLHTSPAWQLVRVCRHRTKSRRVVCNIASHSSFASGSSMTHGAARTTSYPSGNHLREVLQTQKSCPLQLHCNLIRSTLPRRFLLDGLCLATFGSSVFLAHHFVPLDSDFGSYALSLSTHLSKRTVCSSRFRCR